jgi:hypothetical protein
LDEGWALVAAIGVATTTKPVPAFAVALFRAASWAIAGPMLPLLLSCSLIRLAGGSTRVVENVSAWTFPDASVDPADERPKTDALPSITSSSVIESSAKVAAPIAAR